MRGRVAPHLIIDPERPAGDENARHQDDEGQDVRAQRGKAWVAKVQEYQANDETQGKIKQ